MAAPLVHVLPGPEELGRRAASLFAEIARKSIAENGGFTAALSGGSTPRRLYELLGSGEYLSDEHWHRAELFWSDERCVPPSDARSNFKLASDVLLHGVPANVHRVRGELDADEAARLYEEEIRASFGADGGGMPVFDLVLLGMGADGHTASLFPGSPAVEESEHLSIAVYEKEIPRVTLTLPVINSARHVVFLVAGAEKAEAVAEVLEGGEAGMSHPAALVRPARGQLIWLLDKEAASSLRAADTSAGE